MKPTRSVQSVPREESISTLHRSHTGAILNTFPMMRTESYFYITNESSGIPEAGGLFITFHVFSQCY